MKVIEREHSRGRRVIYLDKFSNAGGDVVFGVERDENGLFVGQLDIKGCLTEGNHSGEEIEKNYSWKSSRLSKKVGYKV